MQLIWIIPEACVHSSLLSLFSVRIGDQSIVGVVDICGHMWTCYVGRPTFGEQPQVSSSRRFVFATCCNLKILKAICIQGMPSRRCCDGRTAAFLRNKPRDLLQLACNSSAIYPVTDTCISCTVVWLLFDCSSFFGMFRLVPCLLGVGKVYAADDFRAEKEWLDGNSATFVLPLCLAGFKCRTKLPYAKNTYVCHRLPCADIDSLKASKNSYSYSGPGWKFGRTSLWCTWRYWVMPMLLNCIQSTAFSRIQSIALARAGFRMCGFADIIGKLDNVKMAATCDDCQF